MESIERTSSSFSLPATPTPLRTPTPSVSESIASKRCEIRRIGGKVWQQVSRTPNIYRKSAESRIWLHGSEYSDICDPKAPHHWICDYCDKSIAIRVSGSTSNHSRHLFDTHKISVKRNRREVQEEEEVGSQEEEETRPVKVAALVARLNVERFRGLLVKWIVQAQVPFSTIEDSGFRDILLALQPSLDRYLIKSHHSISKWVKDDYQEARQHLKSLLNQSRSRIHISFDTWTSPNCKAILGICAHFLSPSLHLRHALIGFKEIVGIHDGENLAEYVIKLILELEINDKIGVFIGDNAGNIDTAVEAIVRRLRPSEVSNLGARRSRCLGHIINLAAKAFILGSDVEAFEDRVTLAAESDGRLGQEELNLAKEQEEWRLRGPVGKYHNIVVFIRATSQRRQAFSASVQAVIKEASEKGEPVDFISDITVILDNCTRWNSTYLSIQRGLRLKRVIQLFLLDFQRPLQKDLLTEEDWDQLKAISLALKPFHFVTLRLEGGAKTGSHGVIWEALPMLDYLMSEVEIKKAQIEQEEEAQASEISTRRGGQRHQRRVNPLLICYQNAWEKLQKYNNKTDQNHEIYAAATLLNPCLRKSWFKRRWTGPAAEYIDQMISKNKTNWEVNYKENSPNQPPPTSQDPLDAWLANISRSDIDIHDEFDEFINGSVLDHCNWQESNIFAWWAVSGAPSLRRWAFDSLSIPAMSAEVERCFSRARRLITFDRNRLSSETMEVLLCYKHWLDTDILEQRYSVPE